jgi:hypothetical protein
MWLLLACHGALVIPGDSGPIGHDSSDTDVERPPHDTNETTDTTGETGDSGDTGETEPVETPDVVVDCNGGADYTTIGAAITASHSGTKIGLRPCAYHEDVDYAGKALDIFGIEGSSQTTIQGTGAGPVVKLKHGETLGTRLAGVTITGGAMDGDYYDAGMRVDGAVVKLEDVVFTGNDGGYGVLYGSGSFFEATDITFTGNRSQSDGGTVLLDNGSFLGTRTAITCTSGSWGLYEHNSTILLDSAIDCGRTYGIDVEGGEIHLRRTRVESAGTAVFGEDSDDTRNERMWFFNSILVGGDTAAYASYMHVKADNAAFWADRTGLELDHAHVETFVTNSVAVGGNCGIKGEGYAYDLGWNAVQGDGGNCRADGYGTITADPMLVDAPTDFHLKAGSPLIDAGNPDADYEDVDGSRNDVGPYGGSEGSW